MKDPRNPWTTLSSAIQYQNPWITVREDQVIRPDGKPGIYGVISAKTATGVVALTEAQEIVLVGQWRYPLERYSWEIVEGGAEPGEDPLLAIQRELAEEAGLRASKWTRLGGEVHLSNAFSSETALLWLAQDLSPASAEPDGTEVLTVRRAPFSEVMRMLQEGEITDAMSIIALHRLALLFPNF